MNTTIKLCFLLVGVAAVCSAYEYEHHEKQVPTPYKYEYGVHDPHTGDIKEAKESGDGHGGVKGYYKLKEADGTERIVYYTADKHLGFTAHVDKIGHAHQPSSSYHEPHNYESQDDTYAWAKAHQQPQHDSSSWDNNDHQEVHYPHHYQPSSPEHKFDLHHDKHHGTSHQYVSLHH